MRPLATTAPLVVALNMGYGHLRPAHALATYLQTELLEADQPPIAGPDEARLWARSRRIYEATTRWSSIPLVGAPLRALVERYTHIPHLHPYRDQSRKTVPVRTLERLVKRGLGRELVANARASGRALLTTFFAPAHAADAHGLERIFCVVTDADINRVWAPPEPGNTRINYLVPSMRALRRLRAYGVPLERIHATGYPLPHDLVGGESLGALKANLAGRLVRLDPKGTFRDSYPDEVRHFLGDVADGEEGRAPLVTFAVGGAGAQTDIVRRFLPGLAPEIEKGRIRLALVAGVRPDVHARFRDDLARHGLVGLVEILFEPRVGAYFDAFNRLLARTDVLWTKPSEITFFGALGLPLILSRPVGVHEWYNRRWARESGAGLKQREARYAAQWLREWLEDGLLAAAAWSGFTRLPKFGLYRIEKLVNDGVHR
jgi:hypothetical protein